MAVFGTIDSKAMAADVVVTTGDATVTTAGDFTDGNLVEVGDILVLSGVSYIVKEVTSATAIELHKNYVAGSGTISAANAIRRTAPKAVAEYVVKGGDTNTGDLVFVDNTEAGTDDNRTRGISSPGWWSYKTYTDAQGNTRHKAELLAALSIAQSAGVGDFEDAIAADEDNTITFTTNNTDKTAAGGAATFLVAVSVTNSGTAAFQWQRRTSTTGRWVNVTGGTSASLALTGLTTDENGYQYRVKVTSDNGAEEVISDTATLTVN